MSSVSKNGRQELTDAEHNKLTLDLRTGNRKQRRRAAKLLTADNNRIDRVIAAQARRLGISPTT